MAVVKTLMSNLEITFSVGNDENEIYAFVILTICVTMFVIMLIDLLLC